MQCSIKRARKVNEGEYDPADYLPVSDKDVEVMYKELMGFIGSVKNQYLSQLLHSFFDNKEFERRFKERAPRLCRRSFGAYTRCDEEL